MTVPARSERDTELSRLLAFVVFIAIVLIPSVVALVRVMIIGVRNASLFGTPPASYIDPGTDPTLWVTAILITLGTAIIAALVAIEAREKRVLVSGLILGLLAAIATCINWWIIAG